MNNWKKSYSRENWAQKVDEEQDKILEMQKREKINKRFEILEHEKDEEKRREILEKMVRDYKFLQYEADNFSEEDMKNYEYVKEELKSVLAKIAKKKNDNSSDSKSWEEYYEEEKIQDDEEERNEI